MPAVIIVGAADELKSGKGILALTSAQAAARIGCSIASLRLYVLQGKITPYPEKIGGIVIFKETDVETFKASRMGSNY